MISDLERLGIETVETLDDVDHGAAVVIRAHGVRPDVMERANERGLEVIDGTCTWVIQEHKELTKLVDEGYTIVLLGTPNHAEVVGMLGFAPDAIVVDEEDEWEQKIPRKKRMALISQSTQPPWKFEKLAAFMVGRSHELKIVNTVCPVTIRRQEDTVEAAQEVDLMVVVGGRSSANTKELTRLVGIAGKPAIQIEGLADLTDRGRVRRPRIVGVTGGTSTPIEDLRDVAERVLEIAGHPGRRRPRRRARAGGARRRRDARPAARPRSRRRPEGAAQTYGAAWPPLRAAGLPVVAIVGRPNVGKSTLFNRFVGQRQAIVEDRARTTRDRMYGDAEWNGRRFIIVDTGGLEVDPADPIELKVQEQARLAIGEADVILFLVDAVSGLTPADEEAAELLRRSTKPVIVAANKADNTPREADAAEFYVARLGGDLRDLRVARPRHRRPARRDRLGAAAGDRGGDRPQGPRGRSRRLGPRRRRRPARAVRRRDEEADDATRPTPTPTIDAGRATRPAGTPRSPPPRDDEPAAIAFVGRPNVGKSSLLNALLGEDRAIVSRRCPGRPATRSTRRWSGAGARSSSSTRPASGAAARSPAGPPPSASRRSAR